MIGTPIRAAHRYSTSLAVAFLKPHSDASGSALNISTSGMFVRTDAPLQRGAVVDFAVAFPDGEPPAAVRAKVAYVGPQGRDFGLGLQFLEDDHGLRPRVHRHIESILHRGNVAALRVLASARDLLRHDGWTQLEQESAQGSFCLTGALRRAAGGDRRGYEEALRAMGSRLGVSPCAHGGFNCHCPIMQWNDVDGRTRKQVIAKVDQVIDAELASNARQ